MKKHPFNWLNIQRAPDNEHGIYSVWSNSLCIYVGKATEQSLQARLLTHYRKSHNEKLNAWINSSTPLCFSFEAMKNIGSIDARERNRIKQFAPITNKLLLKKEHQYGN